MKVVGYEQDRSGLLVLWNFKLDYWVVDSFFKVDEKALNIIHNDDDFNELVCYYRTLEEIDGTLFDENSRIVFMPLKDNKDMNTFYYTDDVDDCIDLTYETIDNYYEPTGIESYWFDLSNKELYELIRDMKIYNYNYAEYELSLG